MSRNHKDGILDAAARETSLLMQAAGAASLIPAQAGRRSSNGFSVLLLGPVRSSYRVKKIPG
jgi:hypothetical protein